MCGRRGSWCVLGRTLCLGHGQVGQASLGVPRRCTHPLKTRLRIPQLLLGPASKTGLHGGNPNTMKDTCVPVNSSSHSARRFPEHFASINSFTVTKAEAETKRGPSKLPEVTGQGLQRYPGCLGPSLERAAPQSEGPAPAPVGSLGLGPLPWLQVLDCVCVTVSSEEKISARVQGSGDEMEIWSLFTLEACAGKGFGQ